MSFSEYSSHPFGEYDRSSMEEKENTLSATSAGKRRALERSVSPLSGDASLANIPIGRFMRAKYSVDPLPSNYELETSSNISVANQQDPSPFPATSPLQFDENLYFQEQGSTDPSFMETLEELWATLVQTPNEILAEEPNLLTGPPASPSFGVKTEHSVALQGSSEFAINSAAVHNYNWHNDLTLSASTYTDSSVLPEQTNEQYNSAPGSSNQYDAEGAQTILSSMPRFMGEVATDTVVYDTTPPVDATYMSTSTFSQPAISSYSTLEGALVPVITQPPAFVNDWPPPMPQIGNPTFSNETNDALNQPSSSAQQVTISVPSQISPDLAEAIETDGSSTICQPISQHHIDRYSEDLLPFALRWTTHTPCVLDFVNPGNAVQLINCIDIGDEEVNVHVDAPYDVIAVSLALPAVGHMLFEIRWPGYTNHVEVFKIATVDSDSGRVLFKHELVRLLACTYKRFEELIASIIHTAHCTSDYQARSTGWGEVILDDMYMTGIHLGVDGIWRPNIIAYNEATGILTRMNPFDGTTIADNTIS